MENTQDPAAQLKRRAALAAAELVENGMVLGLGTGTTAQYFVRAIGKLVHAGWDLRGVPTSERTARLAASLGIPLTTLDEIELTDLTVDGADQLQLSTLQLIKGHGGALLREKLVARASRRTVIVVDGNKVVEHLGEGSTVPVEIVPFGGRQTAAALARLGCEPRLRLAGQAPFVTDEGHQVVDCLFPGIEDPPAMASQIKAIVGVIEHGLFIDIAHEAFVAREDGVQRYELTSRR